jgi:hypothetical protein
LDYRYVNVAFAEGALGGDPLAVPPSVWTVIETTPDTEGGDFA